MGKAVAMSNGTNTIDVVFTTADELGAYFDDEQEANTNHLEVVFEGRLDPDLLRAAVKAALSVHPMARARQKPVRWSDRQMTWTIPAYPDVDCVGVVRLRSSAELDPIRADFLDAPVPLDVSPPVRFLLASVPGHDVLFLKMHHAALDGVSSLRLMRSIALAYCGEADPLPDVDPLVVRNDEMTTSGPSRPTGPGKIQLPARVAPHGGRRAAGYGYVVRSSPSEPLTSAKSLLPSSPTVNDLLQAALHLTIASWNSDHGRRCGIIRTTMPLNGRPAGWRDEIVGNFSGLASITSAAADRSSHARLIERIVDQTRAAKRAQVGASIGPATLLLRRGVPVGARRWLVRLGRRVGSPLVDTSLITNLGVVDGLSFGDAGTTVAVLASTPAPMPRGLSAAVVTVRGQLHFGFRYRVALFDNGAAAQFADRFLQALDSLTDASPSLT